MRIYKTIAFIFAVLLLKGQSLHYQYKDLPCLRKHYHFDVHLVMDSLRNVQDISGLEGAIQNANQMFAPICLSFSICGVDTVENYKYEALYPEPEIGELATLFNQDRRINLYIVQDTLKAPGVGGLCAGGVGSRSNANIYLLSLGSLTHELGHFFGLSHTFEGNGTENVDGSNCETEGDRICDTPADPFVPGDPMTDYIEDCVFISLKKDANGEYYQPHVGNIMSYYPCSCGFTRGQYLKMANNYFNSNLKHW